MKKSNLVLKAGVAALLASVYSTGASADVINGNATANVIAPLLLSETTAMNFGDVAGSSVAGTVVLTTGGLVTAGAGASTMGGTPAAGEFTIQGAALAYTLTMSGSATLVGPGADMTVTALNANNPALDGTLQSFQIGGTLNIGASQAAGVYTTTGGTPFTVTANYN